MPTTAIGGWLRVGLLLCGFAGILPAQGKERSSKAPPQNDTTLARDPKVPNPEVAFALHVAVEDLPADTNLRLRGAQDRFQISERLFEGDAGKEPARMLAKVLGPHAIAGLEVPLRRPVRTAVQHYWGFCNPEPGRQDNLYIVSGALGPDFQVLAFKCIRGRDHLTTASSRLEVVDFANRFAIALVGNWAASERPVGRAGDLYATQHGDDVRLVHASLDESGMPKEHRSLYIRHYWSRMFLPYDERRPGVNTVIHQSLGLFLFDTPEMATVRPVGTWAEAKAQLPVALQGVWNDYQPWLSGQQRFAKVFADGRVPTPTKEPLPAPQAKADRANLRTEGAMLLIPWIRCNMNHAPTLGVTDPRDSLLDVRQRCAAVQKTPNERYRGRWFHPGTSASELGDVVVTMGAKCVVQAAWLRAAQGWTSLEDERFRGAAANHLGVDRLTRDAVDLLGCLWAGGAENPPVAGEVRDGILGDTGKPAKAARSR